MSHILGNIGQGFSDIVGSAKDLVHGDIKGAFQKGTIGTTESTGLPEGAGKAAVRLAPVAGAVAGSLIPGLGTVAGGALGGALGGGLGAPPGQTTRGAITGGVGGAVGGVVGPELVGTGATWPSIGSSGAAGLPTGAIEGGASAAPSAIGTQLLGDTATTGASTAGIAGTSIGEAAGVGDLAAAGLADAAGGGLSDPVGALLNTGFSNIGTGGASGAPAFAPSAGAGGPVVIDPFALPASAGPTEGALDLTSLSPDEQTRALLAAKAGTGGSPTVGQSLLPTGQQYGGSLGLQPPGTGAGPSGVGLTGPQAVGSGAGGLTPPAGALTPQTTAPSMFGRAWNALTSSKYLPLAGALGTSLLLGQRKIPQSGYLGNEQNLGPQAQAAAASAQQGNVTPAQQAQIDKWTTDQVSTASQYLSSAGMGGITKDPKTGEYRTDSTAGQQMLANIKQQALAMQQGFADQLFNQSMTMLNVSDSATRALIDLQLRRQEQTGQALSSFMQAYGLLGGLGGARG